MPIKKKTFLIAALFYILYLLFPLFSDIFNIPVWLPSIAVVAIMVYLYPKAFANKTFYWFLVYALVLGLYVIVGKDLTIGIGNLEDSKKILIEFAYIMPTISIFCILKYLDDINLTRKMVNWSIGLLFVSFIVTVPLMLRYGSIREAQRLSDQGISISVLGLPSYSLMHAYTLFLPVFCYGVKVFSGRKKWLLLLGLLVLSFVVYDTFVTTSLVIMIVMLIFTIFYSDNRSVFFLVFGGLAIVIYVLYKAGFFISLIDWMMPTFEGTVVEPKLVDFRDYMMHENIEDGAIMGRQNLHTISWNSFYQNPFFGTSIVGGHSSLIDRFGGMGIVAGLPYLMIFITFVRQMVRQYTTKKAKTFFLVGIITGFVYLYEKGNWGCEAWLMYMVLMPMGILSLENTQSKS